MRCEDFQLTSRSRCSDTCAFSVGGTPGPCGFDPAFPFVRCHLLLPEARPDGAPSPLLELGLTPRGPEGLTNSVPSPLGEAGWSGRVQGGEQVARGPSSPARSPLCPPTPPHLLTEVSQDPGHHEEEVLSCLGALTPPMPLIWCLASPGPCRTRAGQGQETEQASRYKINKRCNIQHGGYC